MIGVEIPQATVVALLEEVGFLQPLSDEELEALAGHASAVSWPAGTVVFGEGDPGDACFVIHRGLVKVRRRLPDGQPITLAQMTEGGVVGELALFAGDRRAATLEAVEDTTAVAISSEDLLAVLRRNADAAIAMAAHITGLLRVATDRAFESATSTPSGRILASLLSQVEAHETRSGAAGGDIELAGTPTDLARLSGASRDETSRVLHWLENEGILTLRRGRIVVHSADALRRFLR